MKKTFVCLLISVFALSCLPAYADGESSGGGGGGSGAGIAVGAVAVIGLLIWALSSKKDAETSASEVSDPMSGRTPPSINVDQEAEIKRVAPSPSGGAGSVKSAEF